MFEISMGAILAAIVLYLYPSLLITVLYVTGFGVLALIAGGVVFSLATVAGIPADNAVWMAIPFSLFGGVEGMIMLTNKIREKREAARFPVR